jgi:hypothetical protein
MHRFSTRTLIALTLAALVLALAACSSAKPADTGVETTGTPVATSSVEPTIAPTAVSTTSSGPIITPGTGTALRAAILDAAINGLGWSGKPTVIQLFSQGTAAVGDIQSTTGKRVFFAVSGGPDDWSFVWSTLFGSKSAKTTALLAAAPEVSPGLAAKLSWKKKAPKAASATPSLSSFNAYAMASAKSMAGADYTGTFTIVSKIAKDSTGVWWGNAIATPSEDGLEGIGVWGMYSNGTWDGEIADFSSEAALAAYFPADVLDALSVSD